MEFEAIVVLVVAAAMVLVVVGVAEAVVEDEVVVALVVMVVMAVVVVLLADEAEPSEAWLVARAVGTAPAPWPISSIGRGGSGLICSSRYGVYQSINAHDMQLYKFQDLTEEIKRSGKI